MRPRITAKIPAKDNDGCEYTVIEFRTEIPTGTLDNPGTHRLSETPSYQTSDGRDVNRVSETEFEIVSSGARLYRV